MSSQMVADQGRLYQLFKYAVYALLTANIFFFFAEEWAAAAHRFTEGIRAPDLIEAFAATIDTAAWVILLLIFELETSVLNGRDVSARARWGLNALRTFCYVFIIYAFYGYLIKMLFLGQTDVIEDITDICAIVDGTWAYAIDLDEYETLTAANCTDFSLANSFLQLPGLSVLVDKAGFIEIFRLSWVDLINSGTWLFVVLVLEMDVRVHQENSLFSVFQRVSSFSKWILYGILLLAAIYWGFKGDFVDFWDAFLWIVAFVFIELNVFNLQQEPPTI
tara:strand:- start:848 stop:1678 length:831 start_codon:yes stop_codon:yes gene_type:complete